MQTIDFSVTPQFEALPSSRNRIRQWLVDAGEPVDDWPLVVSELLANAVSASTEPIVIHMEITIRDVLLEVTDQGPGFELAILSPDATGRRGRGLWIVSALMDSVVVEQTAVGNTVRCRRRRVSQTAPHERDGHLSVDDVADDDDQTRLEPFDRRALPNLDGRRRTNGHHSA